MVESLLDGKIAIRRLPTYTIPLQQSVLDGGRIMMPNGELTQILNSIPVAYVGYAEYRAGDQTARGNHVHPQRDEYYYQLTGRVHGYFQDSQTLQVADLDIQTGDLLHIAAGIAHAFVPQGAGQAIEASTQSYQADGTLTYHVHD